MTFGASPARAAQDGVSSRPTQTDGGSARSPRAEAIRDHVDAADELVDHLLDWRHVNTHLHGGQQAGESTTLISVDADQIQRLGALLNAISSAVPAGAPGVEPHGDLRAHVDKAVTIGRELGTATATTTAAGTAGANAPPAATDRSGQPKQVITVDRTALQRLEIEIEAMKLLAPRSR
jgi:hypothetical protein